MSPCLVCRRAIGPLLIVMPTLVAGCVLADRPLVRPQTSPVTDSKQLRASKQLQTDLKEFLAYLEDEVSATAERIDAGSRDADVRKAALLWRIRVISRADQAMAADDPLKLLLNGWALCVRQVEYLQTGEGAALFADQQPEAVATAVRLRNRIEAIARTHLPEDEVPDLLRRIEAHARANPIHGVFELDVTQAFSAGEDGRSLLQRFVGSPLRSLARVGQDALDPTSRLADSVDRFTELVQDYPALLRWQAQLLWLQLEESPSMRTTVAGVEEVSESSARLATVAEELPRRVREEVRTALDDFIAQQPELRQTIQEARETVDAANAALKQAETVATTIERSISEASNAGKAWQRTAESVTGTVKEIQVLSGTNKEDQAGNGLPPREGVEREIAEVERPFDINDYTRTAEALAQSSEDVRTLLLDVRNFLEAETLEENIARINELTAAALRHTKMETRSVIDHLSWRAAQLCGLVFVLALVYRRIATRWTGRPIAGQHV